jgi:undecaprenol kinase/diacylglycerol kinase (ATP)
MKLIRSFGYAIAGVRACFKSELNFKFHMAAAIAAILFSMLFKTSASEWVAVAFCIAFVLTMEIMNTAIEKLCDVVHNELHPGIKIIKDITAGAFYYQFFLV